MISTIPSVHDASDHAASSNALDGDEGVGECVREVVQCVAPEDE